MYIEKGYMSDGMRKLDVMTIMKSNMNKGSSSTDMVYYDMLIMIHYVD